MLTGQSLLNSWASQARVRDGTAFANKPLWAVTLFGAHGRNKMKKQTAKKGAGAPSRREFIATAGATALALATRGTAWAQSENVLKVGFISPRTGPLAGFGETDGYALELARKRLAEGFAVGGKKYQVEILDRDTQSDPARAGQLAKNLITEDKVEQGRGYQTRINAILRSYFEQHTR